MLSPLQDDTCAASVVAIEHVLGRRSVPGRAALLPAQEVKDAVREAYQRESRARARLKAYQPFQTGIAARKLK